MDVSTRSMRHSSEIEMRLWKMWISFTNLFSITHSLICQLPETPKTKESKISIYLITGKV